MGRTVDSEDAVVVCESGCLTRTAGALNNVLDVDDLLCEISRYFLIVGVSGAVNLSRTEEWRTAISAGQLQYLPRKIFTLLFSQAI